MWEQIEEAKTDEREIMFRKPNLIFQEVTKSPAEEYNTKVEDDLQEVREILRDLEVSDANIKSMTRLKALRGVQQSGNNRPRLLKIVFQSEEHKWKVLKQGGKLRNIHAPNRKNVRLMPDRIFKERQAHTRLAEERDAKNKEFLEKGTQDRRWKIMNGKLNLMHSANSSRGNEN